MTGVRACSTSEGKRSTIMATMSTSTESECRRQPHRTRESRRQRARDTRWSMPVWGCAVVLFLCTTLRLN
eukprot:2613560-Prymnesium_polylepis.2